MVLEAFGHSTDRDACLPSRESPMSERTRDIARGAGVVALVAFVSACSDRSVPSGPGVTPAVAGHVLTCQADLPARTVICAAPTTTGAAGGAAGISADLVLGGQGTYVGLRSSGVSYNSGTQIFQANVTVQNLTALPLGTSDGAAGSGAKVFFHSGPTVTMGTGTVTVANADNTGNFTGTNQPYFFYNEILQPVQVSSARNWQWNVPSTV